MFKEKDLELIGHFGVDSGSVVIIDPCYLKYWTDGECEFDKVGKETNHYADSSNVSCGKTYPSKYAGNLSGDISAVASSTGWGDGEYPVFIRKNKEGRIKQIVIDFAGEINTEE